jgi:hypothetical protein
MLRGVARLRFRFTLTMAAYDLIGCRTCLGRPHDRQKEPIRWAAMVAVRGAEPSVERSAADRRATA